MNIRIAIFFTLVWAILLSGCTYSLKSASIADNIETYYVDHFEVTATNAPATINQTFTEALKDKISRESRLRYSEENPHIIFEGTVQSFAVTSVAPLPDERTSFNRLTISVSIEYSNTLNPKDTWTKSFSHFEDFRAEDNLLSVQDELITVIFNQILEDVFNQAFNNW